MQWEFRVDQECRKVSAKVRRKLLHEIERFTMIAPAVRKLGARRSTNPVHRLQIESTQMHRECLVSLRSPGGTIGMAER